MKPLFVHNSLAFSYDLQQNETTYSYNQSWLICPEIPFVSKWFDIDFCTCVLKDSSHLQYFTLPQGLLYYDCIRLFSERIACLPGVCQILCQYGNHNGSTYFAPKGLTRFEVLYLLKFNFFLAVKIRSNIL